MNLVQLHENGTKSVEVNGLKLEHGKRLEKNEMKVGECAEKNSIRRRNKFSFFPRFDFLVPVYVCVHYVLLFLRHFRYFSPVICLS